MLDMTLTGLGFWVRGRRERREKREEEGEAPPSMATSPAADGEEKQDSTKQWRRVGGRDVKPEALPELRRARAD